MTPTVEHLARAGVLAPLDVQFARTMARLCPEQAPEVILGAAFASRAIGHGHVCSDLARLVEAPLLGSDGQPVDDIELPPVERWADALSDSPLVGTGSARTPLVLVGPRLYLFRYWSYQRGLIEQLRARTGPFGQPVATELARAGIERLFPAVDPGLDMQRVAAAVALDRSLCVISGGPGTGKTTTVAKILALCQEQARHATGSFLRIALLAPTGKAASRLGEAIQRTRATLPCDDDVREAIPVDASTIHRRLGYLPWAPTRFRHDADAPLAADVVLVDEASMVDLALMAKLVAAVPRDARLILLGDRDQLASVEAGAILGDICNTGAASTYSTPFTDRIEALTGSQLPGGRPDSGIWDSMAHLTRSYRFDRGSGIGGLSRAINDGSADEALASLRRSEQDVALRSLAPDSDPNEILGPAIEAGYRAFLSATQPRDMLERLGDFRILCAHRRGPLGVEAINELAEARLQEAKLIDVRHESYVGRPISITRNDYQLGLFNGDVGVIATDPEDPTRSRAYFIGPDGQLLGYSPARLPPHETVFATTVHKAQGSEYEHVALLLPQQLSPILTRELVYTGVTRARKRVDIYGEESVLVAAIGRRIERASGLRQALWERVD